jgi:hypothetical protein
VATNTRPSKQAEMRRTVVRVIRLGSVADIIAALRKSASSVTER